MGKRLAGAWLIALVLLPVQAREIHAAGAGRRPGESAKKGKNLGCDAALVAAATCVYVLAIPDTRRRIFREASIAKVWNNFKDPFWSAREGGRMDHNGFWINCVGHPLSYMALGLYLRERGYGNLETLAFTQTVNILWEYVIEGSMWLPSSKDLLSDLGGSLAAIYVAAPLSDLGERKLAAGDRRWGNYLLYWLNPFKKINRLLFGASGNCPFLLILPRRGGAALAVSWVGR
jgi:hypothetical protein